MAKQENLSALEVRVALESSILRLRRIGLVSLLLAIAGFVLVVAVLPAVQGPLRRLAGTTFGLMVALGFFAAFSSSILIWDRRNGLKQLQGGEDERS